MSAQGDFLTVLFQPLVSVRAAAWLLGCGETQVLHLIDSGGVRAWNLASPESSERYIRVARHSVERMVIPAAKALPLAFPLEILLPHSRGTLLRREVERLFDCSDDHVRRLQSGGCLTGPILTQTGSGRLHHISRESLLGFLTQREL